MLIHILKSVTILAVGVMLCACATKSGKVVKDMTVQPASGEVAVFGKVSLIEEIDIRMPTGKQNATVYMKDIYKPVTIRVSCDETGAFSVYLPPGSYSVSLIRVGGYTFEPDLRLGVPAINQPIYAGLIELDGNPTGVETGTGKSIFVYSVMDESREFAKELERKAPGSAKMLVKSLFKPGRSIATGDYPTKVRRTQDIENELAARTTVLEEIISGTIVTFTNPLWLVPAGY